MSKCLNIARISPLRWYSFEECSKLLNCHIRTAQIWHSQGLPVLDENRRPYLVQGKDLISFLQKKRDSRRVKLDNDECYCVKCRAARKGIPETRRIIVTGKSLGKNAKQYILKATCEVCERPIQRFTSDKKIAEYSITNANIRELSQRRVWNDNSSLNPDKDKEMIYGT